MSSQTRWKILAAVIVASVIVGAVGWQQFTPKPTPPTTIRITPTVTTVSASQATVAPIKSTEWIQVGQVKPITYYLSLLESNGTQPYVRLAQELRKLPDLTNATAVAKITYLALNATNPEVKEAFELMIKGGTPDPRDFGHSVPDYNTELQVLYWLACQNEFRKDDTLALAIGMVNGLWVTMGDEQVRAAVYGDINELLSFGRETSELQRVLGLSYNLEDYPLEARVCWAWTGAQCPTMAKDHTLSLFKKNKLDLRSYLWNTVSIDILRAMRETWTRKKWTNKDVNKALANVEDYFYAGELATHNWVYTMNLSVVPSVGGKIVVDGEEVGNYIFGNLDFQFRYFLETGKGYGVSIDNANLIDAFAKSLGISSTCVWQLLSENIYRPMNHPFAIYYEPIERSWKVWPLQARESHRARQLNESVDYYVFSPPVSQAGYVPDIKHKIEGPRFDLSIYVLGRPYHLFKKNTTVSEMTPILTAGLPTSQMKQWLLYS